MTVGMPFARSMNMGLTVGSGSFGISTSNPDNSAAIQSAIDYLSARGGGCLKITQPGTYVLGSPDAADDWLMVKLASNITIEGCLGAVLQAADGLNTATETFRMFGWNDAGDLENVGFYNITFDMNGQNNLVPASDPAKPNQAIYILRGERLRVEGCAFINNAGRQSVHFGDNTDPQKCRDVQIVGNTFDTAATAVSGNVNQTDHSAIYCQALGATIRGNYFSNPSFASVATAIESHCSRSAIDDNTVLNFGAGLNIVATVNDQEDVVYSSNVIKNCARGVNFFCFTGFTMQRVKVLDNYFEQDSTALTVVIDANANVQSGSTFTDVEFRGNTVKGAFTDFDGELHGISVGRAARFKISGNKILNCTGSAVNIGTAETGILDIDVDDNEIIDCGVTDESLSRIGIRLDSLLTLDRIRVRRNTVSGTIVSTVDTATGTPTLSNVTDIANWQVGMPISGPGIPVNTTVQSIDAGGNEITMTNNATASATVTVFAHARIGLFSNATINYATIEGNDFDRETIGDSGIPVSLTGTVTEIRQQTFDPGATIATTPSATVFGNDRVNSSLVLDNPAGGIGLWGIAFAGAISHWLLWTTSQLQIATAGVTRLVADADQFNPAVHNAMVNGLVGSRWKAVNTLGIAFEFNTATTPDADDYYIQTNAGTVTLPAASAAKGRKYEIENTSGAGTATVARTGGDTINGAASDKNIPTNTLVHVISDGVSDWRYCEVGTVT